jgi:hypothetical protein
MEWQVFEHNGRLFLVEPAQRPDWLTTCAVPDWPNDPGAAAMALAAWCMETGATVSMAWFPESRLFGVAISHHYDMRKRTAGEARKWETAVMLAVLAGVENR